MVRETVLARDLAQIVGHEHVHPGSERQYLQDATETRGLVGSAAAIVLPGSAEEVAEIVAYCYARDLAIVPRGGGTGYAGGAIPHAGAVVVALERLTRIRSFEPLSWRIDVEAGVRTAELRRIARQSGLWFPPDPGGAEQSQIGGNIATNAGGPHTFKYGVTGAWVTSLEVVVAPGTIARFGSSVRKDVSSLDMKSLLVGSEGTLGIVTAARLKLLPAPEASIPVVAFYEDVEHGCAAVQLVLASGLVPATLEYLDAGTLAAAGRTFPGGVPERAGFLVASEVDGRDGEIARVAEELAESLAENALEVRTLAPREARELWRWRDGVSLAVAAMLGGKAGEDIVVPVERLAEELEELTAIAERHALDACSWGHAGDGNVHANFLFSRDGSVPARVEAASAELFATAVRLGGSITGEHGIGRLKLPYVSLQHGEVELGLQAAVKRAFDPKGLFNPGTKLPVTA